MKQRIGLIALTTVLATAAIAAAPSAGGEIASTDYSSVLIQDVPHVRQKPDFCGEACAAMYLTKLGLDADQDYVFDQSGLDPLAGRGCYTKELASALSRIGFRIGPVWNRVDADQARQGLDRCFTDLHRDLLAGVPSIICMHYDDRPDASEHFRLILGFDAQTDEVIYHEPAMDQGAYQRMQRTQLLKCWPLKYDQQQWTVIRMKLQPARLVRPEPAQGFTNADYAQHIHRLKPRLPSNEFHLVLQKPFVVIGDESPNVVRRRSQQTVQWAVERIKRDYFAKDPDQIIDIWLFRDKESYDTHAELLFGSKPTTPFGYYSAQHRALVMNISTGGGTLVHELVHPFMASNFPDCPAWFNEGLASLYEQCQDRNGRIWGLTNWRLRGLQVAIASKQVPSFKKLCSTTAYEFYRQDPGTNYAQARYLCLYLQEQGKLVPFYRLFVETARQDPTGYSALQDVLEVDDMEDFQKRWEEYVSRLRF